MDLEGHETKVSEYYSLSSLMNSQYVVLETPTVAGITTKAALYTL